MMKICVAQLNPTVGDLQGNLQKIEAAAQLAHEQQATILLTPELSLSGGPAKALQLSAEFAQACEQALARLAEKSIRWPELHLIVGHPAFADAQGQDEAHAQICQAASVIRSGKIIHCYKTTCFVAPDGHEEARQNPDLQSSCVLQLGGARLGLLLGAHDLRLERVQARADQAADALLSMQAPPFLLEDEQGLEPLYARLCASSGLPLAAAHLVGAQDDVIYAGASLGMAADGQILARAQEFEAGVLNLQLQAHEKTIRSQGRNFERHAEDERLWRALVLALHDYVYKNGFSSVMLGLSGGLDSALVLALAVDALGADAVHAVMMPSPYTADISVEDAYQMALRTGASYVQLDIQTLFETFLQSLEPFFTGLQTDTTEENIQARVRGVLLMALANKFAHLVLACGNKSELAVGYCTLYGDMCGGFAPICDVYKTRARQLALWRNAHDPFGRGMQPIPERIITRPPSAELRQDQIDADSLPPYEQLDAMIEACLQGRSSQQMVASGFEAADVQRVLRLIRTNAHKRDQAALGPQVSRFNLGKTRRVPLTNRFQP